MSSKEVTPKATGVSTNASGKLIDTKTADGKSTAEVLPAASTPSTPKKAAAPAAKKRTKEEQKRSFRFIMGYAKRECCSIVLGIFFLIGGAMSDLSVPYFIGKVIDLLEKGDYGAIGDLCLYMLAIIIVSGICVGMRAAIFNILSERIARNLRRDFYESIVNKDIEFFDARRTGDLGK